MSDCPISTSRFSRRWSATSAENLWGVNGGLDPAVEEFTADLNMKLGNLPVAPPAKDVLEPRFVDAALKKFGPYQAK